MSILFRCPCGRSMVVESDRAGAVVTCPNCRRSLKVPSGKDRGVELSATPLAATTRTSRRCQRCGKDVPVDSQMCPHCKAIVMEEGAAAAPVARPTATRTKRAPARSTGPAIRYGGARGGWFSRLTSGGKAGVLVGAFVFLILLTVVIYVSATSWQAGQKLQARQRAENALAEGRKLATEGKFQEAYNLYMVPTEILKQLKSTGFQKDTELADTLQTRAFALQYLVPQPKTRDAVQWKPKSQQDFDQALAHLKATYPAYRQLCKAVGEAGLTAVATARKNPNRPAFQEKASQTIEAYVRLVAQTTPQQRAQFTFQTLTSALKELGGANRNWDGPERKAHVDGAEAYFIALMERVSKPGYPDAIW